MVCRVVLCCLVLFVVLSRFRFASLNGLFFSTRYRILSSVDPFVLFVVVFPSSSCVLRWSSGVPVFAIALAFVLVLVFCLCLWLSLVAPLSLPLSRVLSLVFVEVLHILVSRVGLVSTCMSPTLSYAFLVFRVAIDNVSQKQKRVTTPLCCLCCLVLSCIVSTCLVVSYHVPCFALSCFVFVFVSVFIFVLSLFRKGGKRRFCQKRLGHSVSTVFRGD
jgi:hypothetical protein